MNIIIQRQLVKGEATEGTLCINGQRLCNTLENSNACLCAGQYTLSLVTCRQYGRKMICVGPPKPPCRGCRRKGQANANSRLPKTCPQLKPGNGIHGRCDGRILVGTRTALGLLIQPRRPFEILYGRIRKALERGHQVQLTINDPQNP